MVRELAGERDAVAKMRQSAESRAQLDALLQGLAGDGTAARLGGEAKS